MSIKIFPDFCPQRKREGFKNKNVTNLVFSLKLGGGARKAQPIGLFSKVCMGLKIFPDFITGPKFRGGSGQ